MAMIKVFSAEGVKELYCFDTLSDVEYSQPEEEECAPEVTDARK